MGNNLYILDRNIRMATMLGIVGAGGIGYRLQSAFRMFKYREVSDQLMAAKSAKELEDTDRAEKFIIKSKAYLPEKPSIYLSKE